MENICDCNKCKKKGHFKAPVEKYNSRKILFLQDVKLKDL